MGFFGQIKRLAFEFENEGANELVAGVEDKKLQVLAFVAVPAGAMDLRIDSGAGGDPLTGNMSVGAKTPLVLSYNPAGWLETAAGDSLSLEAGGSQRVAGCFSYLEV